MTGMREVEFKTFNMVGILVGFEDVSSSKCVAIATKVNDRTWYDF